MKKWKKNFRVPARLSAASANSIRTALYGKNVNPNLETANGTTSNDKKNDERNVHYPQY